MRTIVVAFAFASFGFTNAQALLVKHSGNDLYKFCSAPLGSFESGMCFGLVTAYFESLHMGFVCKGENESITPK
jgi:hypothetical protein